MTYPPFHQESNEPLRVIWDQAAFTVAFPREDERLEFKQGLPVQKIAETATAFANTDGGVLLLGVDDEGGAIGLTLGNETEQRVHAALRTVHNPGRYDLHRLDVEGRTVLAVAVDVGRAGVAQTAGGQPLIRRGAANVPAMGEDLLRLVRERSVEPHETSPTRVPARLMSGERRLIVAQAWGWTVDEHLDDRLRERRFVVQDRGDEVLSIAGAMLLLQDPPDEAGKAFIELFRYPDDGERYDRRVTIDGPIDEQIRVATDELLQELGFELVVVGATRHELPRLPAVVVREAVSNAVAHRDYSVSGSSIRIAVRPGRVTITSPGLLPGPVNIHHLRDQNFARNRLMIDTLRRLRLAEDAGRGIDVMEDAMRAHMLAPPAYREHAGGFEVELSTTSTVMPEERAWLEELELTGSIDADARRVLVEAARGSELTNTSVRTMLGVDSVDARNILQRLRDEGYLVQHGERGGATYELASEVRRSGATAPSVGSRVHDDILALAEAGPVTNGIVRTSLGLDRADAARALRRLVDANLLRAEGERRGTRYFRVR